MKNSNVHVVILAGGSGTRFWPLSRKDKPKQFLQIVGTKTLFQQTLERIKPLVGKQNIWIVTNQDFLPYIKSQSKGMIASQQILSEPSGKNTAPAIAWAASRIHQKDKNAVMVILPSDHLIQNPKAFVKHIEEAEVLARSNYLVTLGIVPTRPETGYGYLKTKSLGKIFRVEKFTEKPSLEKAKQFIRTKKYYWNSGMFVWRVEVILAEFEKYLPQIYQAFSGKCDNASIRRLWNRLPSISIDYGILEKASRVAAIPAGDMGWSDLGSWEALFEVLPKDQNKNVFKGQTATLECKNTLIMSGHRMVAAIGLENFVIVDTPDALLICPKDKTQLVRQIASQLHS